ncbi:MAG: hypothetical protein ACYSTL_05235 [Planctomycetota bacterium]
MSYNSLMAKERIFLGLSSGLAAARIDKRPAHCPAATGAGRSVVLGNVNLP